MKLSSIRIVTSDVPALSRFYEMITGIPPVGNADYVEFETPGATLVLCSQRSVDIHNPAAASSAANRSVILEFPVADVDTERLRLDSMTVNWVMEPTNQPWGNRSMLFRDPDGNLINFYAPITGELNER